MDMLGYEFSNKEEPKIKYNSFKFCPDCEGKKKFIIEHKTYREYKKCKTCKGKGTVKAENNNY